jgi:hypothetical protein
LIKPFGTALYDGGASISRFQRLFDSPAPLPFTPATVIPDQALDNEVMLSRVRESFRGLASEWDPIEQSIGANYR